MASIREQIMQKIVSVLNAGNIGGAVYRSRTDPVSREQSPAVIVQPVADSARQDSVPYLDWSLTVHVTLYVRGAGPDVQADPILTAINAALLADLTLGGLAMTILPQNVHFEFTDADSQVCVATSEYLITYRTNEQDLTQ